MILRTYQRQALDDLWAWFHRHPTGNPIVEAAVGAGKSVMIAALAQRVDIEAPGTRVLVLVHQRELLDQNLEKLKALWPEANAGIISASHGKKQINAQVIFATIGSVYKIAHLLGNIGVVMADECHMIQSKETGMWRSFLSDLFRYCPRTRVIGWTGTPFRNGGIWLTAGESPLFTHIAAKVTMRSLIDDGFLSPLTTTETSARIDTSNVRISGGDYVISELAKAADRDDLIQSACDEIVKIAQHRKRWLVFAVTVKHAEHITAALKDRGIVVDMVSGETPKQERDLKISAFRNGDIRCLVNVAVLTTGFDAPEVDFIALMRSTKSPTLYVQICGRGMRLSPGKTDCLFADFTDTVETLGPVDSIKGRTPKPSISTDAPFKNCPECGSQNATGSLKCCDCGFDFPEPERVNHKTTASNAAIMAHQVQPKIVDYPVSDVRYSIHQKEGKPDSLRVDYYAGLRRVGSEWVCLSHYGFARAKAEKWWQQRASRQYLPGSTDQAIEWINSGYALTTPTAIRVNETGKYPEIIGYQWEAIKEAA